MADKLIILKDGRYTIDTNVLPDPNCHFELKVIPRGVKPTACVSLQLFMCSTTNGTLFELEDKR